MLSIVVLITSLSSVGCFDFCKQIDLNSVQTYRTGLEMKPILYSNGFEWDIKINSQTVEMDANSVKAIDKSIVNRIGGMTIDCGVRYKSGNSGPIVTNCTTNLGSTEDDVSKYDPKALIFEASLGIFVIYSQRDPKISCYQPTERELQKRLTMGAKCENELKKTQLNDYINEPLMANVNGLIDFTYGQFLFFNINCRPMYCFQAIHTNQCKSMRDLKPLFSECPDICPKTGPKAIIIWISIVFIVLVIVLGLLVFTYYTFRRQKKKLPKEPSTVQTVSSELGSNTSAMPAMRSNISPQK